jgi:hypothetical protein
LDNGRTGATSAPLFHSIGQGRSKSAPAAFSWHVVTLVPAETDNPWQACHNLVTQSAVTSAPIDFAEPDLQQQWLLRREDLRGLSITGTCVTANGPDLDYPIVAGNPLWFRDLAHGQVESQREIAWQDHPRNALLHHFARVVGKRRWSHDPRALDHRELASLDHGHGVSR